MLLGVEEGLTIGQVWAPVVSAVLVAAIGALATILTTRSNRNKAKTSAEDARASAALAADYALALGAKNAVIESLEQRVRHLEDDKGECEERCTKMERQLRLLLRRESQARRKQAQVSKKRGG